MTMLVLYSLLLIALSYLIGCVMGSVARNFFGEMPSEPRYVTRNFSNYAEQASAPSIIASGRGRSEDASSREAKSAETKSSKAAQADEMDASTGAVEKPEKATPAADKEEKTAGSKTNQMKDIEAACVDLSVSESDENKAAAADAVGVRPKVLAGPIGDSKDNLKLVKGIGPVNEKKLNELGVFHFAQIASWSDDEAKWIGEFLAFPGRIEREDWIAQAGQLAKGE